MPVSRRWSLIGLTAVAIGTLVPVQSYARVDLSNTGILQVSSPMNALISTPIVVAAGGGPLRLKLPEQASAKGDSTSEPERPLEAFAIVANHTDRSVLAAGVGCANPDLFVTLVQPMQIPGGDVVRLPLRIATSTGAGPGTEPVSLSFLFTWPGGQALIGTQTTITIVQPPDPPSSQSQTSSSDGP